MKRRLSPVVLLELLLIGALLVAAVIVPRHEIAVPASAFDAGQSQQVSMSEDRMTVSPAADGSAGQLYLMAYGLKLRPGAYEICVSYDSDTDGRGDFYARGATFVLDANRGITTDYINLNDAQTKAYGRAWVQPRLRGAVSAAACVTYLGKGSLEIDGVTLTEIVGYRFVCIAALALLLLALHALHAFFFSSREIAPKNMGVLLVLIGIVLAASLPNFVNFAYEGHDASFHLKRIATLAEELRYGQFPVRMHTTVGNGYSYPLSLYYGDFLLYLPAMLYNCAVPLQMCFQIYALMINALTCGIAYFCFRRMTGNRQVSLLGAALYVLSCYRLTNVYVRAAVGEYTALAFMPLALLGMVLIMTKEKPRYSDWLPLSLGMTGVALSHILSTEMLAFDLVLLCLCFVRQVFHKERLLAIIKAAVLCLALSSWFLIPFIHCFLGQSVVIQTTDINIQERGTFLIQLFSMFTTGYGDGLYYGLGNRMPLAIGASLMVGMAAMLYCLYQRHQWQLTQSVHFKWIRAALIIAALNLALTLERFPWDEIQRALGSFGSIICSMQFPWRWIAVATPLLVLGTVLALHLMEKHDRRMYTAFAAAALACLVVGTGYFYFRFINEVPIYPSYFKSAYEGADKLYYLTGTDTAMLSYSVCEVEEGDASVTAYEKERGVARLTVNNDSSQEAQIAVPVFNYIGYRAYDEAGNMLETVTGGNNRVAVRVPANYHGGIEVRFVSPLIWRIAEGVTAAGLAFMAVMAVRGRKKKKG